MRKCYGKWECWMLTSHRKRFVWSQAHAMESALPKAIGFCIAVLGRFQTERAEWTGSVCEEMHELLHNSQAFRHWWREYEAGWSRHSLRCSTVHHRRTTCLGWFSVTTVFCEKKGTGIGFDMWIMCPEFSFLPLCSLHCNGHGRELHLNGLLGQTLLFIDDSLWMVCILKSIRRHRVMNYNSLKQFDIERFIKRTDKILFPGCGNSCTWFQTADIA